MTDLNTITGNPIRSAMIKQTIRKVITEGNAPTIENVSAALPGDFGVLDDELAAGIQTINETEAPAQPAEVAATEAPDTLAATDETPKKPEPQPQPDDEEPTPFSTAPEGPEEQPFADRAEALAHIENIDQLIATFRVSLNEAAARQRRARTQMANAITAWQTGGKPLTALENQREFQRSAVEQRRQRATGIEQPRGNVANSYIDRAAKFAHGGDANDFVRSKFQHGGSKRGAMSLPAANAVHLRQSGAPGFVARKAERRDPNLPKLSSQR
jgi:hypothetical protein